jgi:hypothetical protein
VLSRFCELRGDLIILFTSEEFDLADLLSDETWCNKVAFLGNILQAFNTLSQEYSRK